MVLQWRELKGCSELINVLLYCIVLGWVGFFIELRKVGSRIRRGCVLQRLPI